MHQDLKRNACLPSFFILLNEWMICPPSNYFFYLIRLNLYLKIQYINTHTLRTSINHFLTIKTFYNYSKNKKKQIEIKTILRVFNFFQHIHEKQQIY
jgi:hypothetical protein